MRLDLFSTISLRSQVSCQPMLTRELGDNCRNLFQCQGYDKLFTGQADIETMFPAQVVSRTTKDTFLPHVSVD